MFFMYTSLQKKKKEAENVIQKQAFAISRVDRDPVFK